MALTQAIDMKLTKKMHAAFSSTQDRKNAVHLTATAGAAIVAALPIGMDAWALRAAECILICCIAGSYGEKLTRSAAKGLMLSSFAQLAGEAAAITALEAAEAARIANPVIVYGIKSGIAVTLIEAVGRLAIAYYEKPGGVGHKLCKGAEKIGFTADVTRALGYVGKKTEKLVGLEPSPDSQSDVSDTARIISKQARSLVSGQESSVADLHAANAVSFTGSEGYSYSHSESYWKEQAAKALAEGRKSGYDYAMKRLKEAVADRVNRG